MSDILSYVEQCTKLIENGSSRDDIDLYLKERGCDAKAAAAVNLELQNLFVEQERNSQRKEEAWSHIIAGCIAMIVNTIFTVYTIVTGGYISLLLSFIMFYFGWKYINKGWQILKDLKENKPVF